jgi:hypothetical protein
MHELDLITIDDVYKSCPKGLLDWKDWLDKLPMIQSEDVEIAAMLRQHKLVVDKTKLPSELSDYEIFETTPNKFVLMRCAQVQKAECIQIPQLLLPPRLAVRIAERLCKKLSAMGYDANKTVDFVARHFTWTEQACLRYPSLVRLHNAIITDEKVTESPLQWRKSQPGDQLTALFVNDECASDADGVEKAHC